MTISCDKRAMVFCVKGSAEQVAATNAVRT